MLTPARFLMAAGALLLPLAADAHGFGRLYNLPVPFWLYAWGASAALLLSFVLAAYFATAPAASDSTGHDLTGSAFARGLRCAAPALRLLGVLLLLLCIATGLFGNRDPQRNFNMTFFWVEFVLGLTYLTALIGNVYAALNPWRTLTDALARLVPGFTQGRVRYVDRWGDWPALALYLGFICFELFGYSKPFSLSVALLGYTALNVLGVWGVGAAAWFRHYEFFSVFLRLVSLLSPLDYRRADAAGERSVLRWRVPFTGLIQDRPRHLSTVIFALAMLSTTAFDGLRATQFWVFLFWSDPTGIVRALAGSLPYSQLARMLPWYTGWETFCLLLSPFLYFGFYALCLYIGKRAARSTRPLRELALDFAHTLLPIALVYGLTHYATLILTQGLKIVSLASDPFGWGWNLFGTVQLLRAPILPSMGLVWHTQVTLIVLGHLISVYLAHRVALRVFGARGNALWSQLPLLLLMMGLTVSGLWILAQPLTVELMR